MNGNAVLSIFRSMELLLYIVSIYLFCTTLVLIRNWFEFRGLAEVKPRKSKASPLVSICIPARNEEAVIDRCVTSALKQDYPNFEVLVLDDRSEDKTTEILEHLSGIITNLHYLSGSPKPHGWLGKPWACQQLSEQAKGEYLVFIDADVWMEGDTISKTIEALQTTDALTVWPKQHFRTFWEHMIIPLIYHALFTLLPAKYVEEDPRWLPKSFQRITRSKFAAACGQFMAFTKKAYHKIGGHKAVQNKIVEDVELAKALKEKGCKLRMYHGVEAVHCRMYQSHQELYNGLRKNFFAGFGKNILLFMAMALMHLVVFVIPFFLFVWGNVEIRPVAFTAITLIFFQRWMLDYRFGWNPLFSLLHPISVLWYQVLGLHCLTDHFTGNKPRWKGRRV